MDGAATTAEGSRGSATWRGRAIITAACFSVLLAACGQSSAAGGRPSAAEPGGGAAAARPGVTTAAPAPVVSPVEFIDLIDLSGPGFGLAGLGAGPQTGGYARLVASTNFGRSFTAIGPRTAAWTVTDDVFFLGRRDGWFAVFNTGTLAETLYRTTDGGRTWHGYAAPGHNMAGGSTDGGARWSQASALPGAATTPSACGPAVSVSFPTPQAAWATAVHAARTVVYRTTDGGRHWEKITSSWPVPPDTGTLPVIQATDAAHAWLLTAGSTRVYATADGGATWRRIDTAATAAGSDNPGIEAAWKSAATLCK